MKLEKAIEILDEEPITCESGRKPELEEALKLGIEALKRIIEFHEDDELLPGETEE